MLVFKFGGASVKEASAVRNLAEIIRKFDDKIIVVVSAMGKTTNALEQVTADFISQNGKAFASLGIIKEHHLLIMKDLFPGSPHPVYKEIESIFAALEERLKETPTLNYDFDYDQIVSMGEIISTKIIAAYLKYTGIRTEWKDIRNSLKSDETYREARIDWELSGKLVKKDFIFRDNQILLTQGFLASTINNLTTTLGREGSDYTAAILAYILKTEKVIIWKDVPGVLNADPVYYPDATLLNELSYRDAIELAYYGAKVIHPKTIQPLQRKNIKLYVRSFLNPYGDGTLIGNVVYEKLIPCFIFKTDQVLIHFFPKDFSFIAEENLEIIIGCFARNGLRINMMQNSAISFQVCVNNDSHRIPKILEELCAHYSIEHENGLKLITIRYYDEETIGRITEGCERIMEQRNTTTAQIVLRMERSAPV